ncbi:UNVERIFIED_CONTAM: hypothetical protein NCL1_56486 [Trichonephila clavipes]
MKSRYCDEKSYFSCFNIIYLENNLVHREFTCRLLQQSKFHSRKEDKYLAFSIFSQGGRQPFSCGVPNQSTNTIQRSTQTSFIRIFIIRSDKYPDYFFLSTTCTVYEYVFEQCNAQQLCRIVTSVQEESDPVDDETDEEEDNNNSESSKGPLNADAFSALETAMVWYEQHSAVLFNYCCFRESETLQRKNVGVQWYSKK